MRALNLLAISKTRNWGPADFVAALGRSPSFWSDRLHGRRAIGEKLARAIEEGLSLGHYAMDAPANRKTAGHASLANHEPASAMRADVPLISWVAAGWWCESQDPHGPGEAEKWLACNTPHSKGTYALRVRGTSMVAPYGGKAYPPGSIIFVDPAKRSPSNGERIVAKLRGGDEVTFKTFKHEDGRTWLEALNPTHEPIRGEFEVLGTVIGKWEEE